MRQAALLVAFLMVLTFGATLLFIKQKESAPAPVTQSEPAIQNKADLDQASKELDATDTNQLDMELNLVGTDAAAL